MRAIRFLVLAALVVRCVADGAPAVAQSMWTRIWENTQLRQNTNVKRDIAKPAFVTFTLPKDGPNTYQIGLGVLAPIVSTTLFEVDTLVDYQRNNAVDAAQNVLKAGTAGEWQWRAMGTREAHNSGLFAFRGDFKDDVLKKSKGWQTAIGYTHVFEGPRVFPHPDDVFPLGNALDLVYFPYGGLEVDRTVQARDVRAQGTVLRAIGQVSLALYPVPVQSRRRVEFLGTYAYRADLEDTTNNNHDRHRLFAFEANVFPVKERRGDVGFGASYTRGEDPDEGFTHQQYWQFSIKVRLK